MKKGYSVLIVDDEIEYQNVLSLILNEEGYDTRSCSNGLEALKHLEKHHVHLIITDLKMPIMDGVELIKRVKERAQKVDIIVLTAFGSIESAVDAIKYGATDYFVKSSDMNELVSKINRLAKMSRLERHNDVLLNQSPSADFFVHSKNKSFQALLEMCDRAADSGISVLLLGESGVGKEVIANYIHQRSQRSRAPFVPVNCQIYPEGIIESELFGHEKGSFTGAVDSRIGKFEQANTGTLFLDEIGDLPIATQGKLLRAIETRQIERIGGSKSISLDLRFICATNKDLEQKIAGGDFREDLYYRINTLTFYIPPLRERREDIPALIDHFIRKIERDQKKKIHQIDPAVMDFLYHYNYPGNVRELKNIIERMIALSKEGIVTVNDMLMPLDKTPSLAFDSKCLKDARSAFEKTFIEDAIKRNQGNVSKTASELEISTRQLWNKINQYGIDIKKSE